MDENDLYEQFFIAVFKKAGEESLKESKTPQADHIADVVFAGKKASSKTFLRLYNKYVSKEEPDNPEPKVELLHALANYLGYKNFIDYSHQVSGVKTEKSNEQDQIPPPDKDSSANQKSTVQSDVEKRETIRKRLEEINRDEAPKIISSDSEKKKIELKKEEIKEKEKSAQHTSKTESKITPKTPSFQEKTIADPSTDKKRKNQFVFMLIVLILGLLFYLIYLFNFENGKGTETSEQICMAWQTDHYVKLDCQIAHNHPNEYQNIKELKDENDFEAYRDKRKIQLYSNSIVFDEVGEPLVWYFLKGGEYEFFNFSGEHPTQSVWLMPVTQEFMNSYFDLAEYQDLLLENKDSLEGANSDKDNTNAQNPCELNSIGGYNFVNQTNGTLKISTKVYGAVGAGEVLFVSPKRQFYVSNVPPGHIEYTAYLYERNLFLKKGDFWVTTCDTQLVEFTGNYELEEKVLAKPSCEINQTGDFSFKNDGADGIRIRITKNGIRTFSTQEISLAGKELKVLRDLPVQEYAYSVYSNTTNELVQKGSFIVKQCSEGKEIIEVGSGGAPAASGEKSSDDCEAKKLGDYCFKNNGTITIRVTISDYTPGSPLSHFFHNIDIESGETGCFYNEPAGAYNVEYYPLKVDARTFSNNKSTKVRIEACKVGQTVLKL